MYEQDYIMRLIKEMVRMVLKLLFHIDAQEPTTELLEEAEQQEREVQGTLDSLHFLF